MPGREQHILIQLNTKDQQGNKHERNKHRRKGTIFGIFSLVFVLTWISGITVFFTDTSDGQGNLPSFLGQV